MRARSPLRASALCLLTICGASALEPLVTRDARCWARRHAQPQEDPLALARKLLQDGEPSRALVALKGLDLKAPSLDLRERERLMGLSSYQLKDYAPAALHFERAVELGDQDPSLLYFYARALAELKQTQRALEVLAQAPEALWEKVAPWKLKLQLVYEQQGAAHTYPLLNQMIERFPKRAELREQRLRLLCELGLFQTASELMIGELQAEALSVEQLLAYARILGETGEEERACLLLERGLLLFETEAQLNAALRQALAHSYLKRGRHFSAAELLFPLALSEPKYALYTAELYRQAGQVERALWVNRLVADQESKIKQRLTLLIEEERYEESAALLDRAQRLGLIKDESIAYALAYSFYRVYDFSNAHALLSHLSSDQMYEKGIQLRRAIDQCRADAWSCE